MIGRTTSAFNLGREAPRPLPADSPALGAAAATHAKIIVLGSYAPSLIGFRGPLLRAMVAAGHEVIGAAPEDDDLTARRLRELGVGYRRIRMDRAGTNPRADGRTLFDLVRLLRAERPDLLLAYTLKPVVYGGIAARLVGVPRFFAMITGLGYAFAEAQGRKRRLLLTLTSRLYATALRRAAGVFFFNPDDRAEFTARRILRPDQPTTLVAGSGVDMDHYGAVPVPAGPPTFLLIARLLRDKGLYEYAEAARRLKARWPQAQFRLIGPLDANPESVTEAQLAAWQAEGVLDYAGPVADVRPHLEACSVFVLPSYYREGIPRTILEAMATGRAIVTTDAPGCRETVALNENGFLVPPRDPTALAAAMARFLEDPALVLAMGRRSEALARERFEVRRVNDVLLRTMGLR